MINNLINLNNLIDTFFLLKKETIISKRKYRFSLFLFIVCLIFFAVLFIMVNYLTFSLFLKVSLDIIMLFAGYLFLWKLKTSINYNKTYLKINKEKMTEVWILVFEIKKYLSEEELKDFLAIRNIELKLYLVDPNI